MPATCTSACLPHLLQPAAPDTPGASLLACLTCYSLLLLILLVHLCLPSLQDFEVDDLGGLMAMVVANEAGVEKHRHLLGPINWLGG